jgi:hypothetical protein
MKIASHLTLTILIASALGGFSGYLLCSSVKNRSSYSPARNSAQPKLKPLLAQSSRPQPDPVSPPRFSWARLEAPDYPTYIQNLRSIGCPEETIRDIVSADLHKLFLQKRSQLAPESYTREAVAALNQHEALVMAELFSPGREFSAQGDLPPQGLSAGNLQGIEHNLKAFEDQENRAAEKLVQQNFSGEALEVLRQIRKAKQNGLAQEFKPEELEQYGLENSQTGRNLRAAMAGVPVDPGLIVSIYRLQSQFEEVYGAEVESLDANYLEQRTQARAELDAKIKAVLGENNFARFEAQMLAGEDRQSSAP